MNHSFRRLCLALSIFCLIFSAGSLLGVDISPSSFPLTLSVFPNSPVIDKINTAEPDASVSQVSSTQTHMTYDIASMYEEAGFNMSYDDSSTETIETCDLSSFSSFVFALKGKPYKVNLIFTDGHNLSKTLSLICVSSNQIHYYEIPASYFTGVLDLREIKMITFKVDVWAMPPPQYPRNGYLDIYSEGQCYPHPVPRTGSYVAPLRAVPNLELLPNPSFDIDSSSWSLFTGDAAASFGVTTDSGEFDTGPAGGKVQVTSSGTQLWQIQLSTGTWNILAGESYKFTFKAKASMPFTAPSGSIKFMMLGSPWADYSLIPSGTLDFTTNWQTYTIQYVAAVTASDARITFHIGGLIPNGESFYVDTLSLKEEPAIPELLPNPSFNNDASGWSAWTPPEASADFYSTETAGEFDSGPAGGKLHVTESGTSLNMVQLETGVWSVVQNHTYEFTFRAKASSPFIFPAGSVKLMQMDYPWANYSLSPNAEMNITADWKTFTIRYLAKNTASDARITFHLGGLIADGADFFIDTLSLKEVSTNAEFLPNPEFFVDTSSWYLWAPAEVSANFARTTVAGEFFNGSAGGKLHFTESGTESYQIQLSTGKFAVEEGKEYTLTFSVRSPDAFTIPSGAVKLMGMDYPWTDFSSSIYPINVTSSWQTISISFLANASSTDARLAFLLGGVLPDGADLFIDSLSLKERAPLSLAGTELMLNPSFDVDTWAWSFNSLSASFSRTTVPGEYHSYPAGGKVVSMGSGPTTILTTGQWLVRAGMANGFLFRAKATAPFTIPAGAIHLNVSMPFLYSPAMLITTGWQTYYMNLGSSTQENASVSFFLNSLPAGVTFYIDSLSFTDGVH